MVGDREANAELAASGIGAWDVAWAPLTGRAESSGVGRAFIAKPLTEPRSSGGPLRSDNTDSVILARIAFPSELGALVPITWAANYMVYYKQLQAGARKQARENTRLEIGTGSIGGWGQFTKVKRVCPCDRLPEKHAGD